MRSRRILAAGILLAVLAQCLTGCGKPEPLPTGSEQPTATTVETVPATKFPTQPTEQSTQPADPPVTVPATQSTEPPTTVPTTQPTEPPTTVPTTQPTEPTVMVPATKPTEPATQPTEPPTTAPVTKPTELPATEPEYPVAIPNQVTVEASGVLVKESETAKIDYSNTKDGYVMVQYLKATDKKLKAQVKGPSTTYTYNLSPEKWAAFPLSDENGEYKITIFRNTEGSKYAAVLSLTVTVQMEDEFAPFLRSNQYVDFDAAPKSVAKAAGLTANLTDPLKKVEKIYDFVVGALTYDKELAATVKSGYLPELDKVLEKKKGICFDYAALMTGMLRSQGVPTKLVVGYAGEVYHAWISVWSEVDGWIDGVIWFDGTSWQRMDPTFASSGGGSGDIMDYIGNGSNYTPKYFY